MTNSLGITEKGLKAALRIKEDYKKGHPLCLPGDEPRMLLPENLMNHNVDLQGFGDPLALAMVAARDPEPPMALAAASRMSPLCPKKQFIAGVFGVVGETSRHPLVRQCVDLVTEYAFSPGAIAEVRRRTTRAIIQTRRQYTTALRQNLFALIDGVITPRDFVKEFFELTEAGNLRHDVRKKLMCSLFLSDTIRPSTKFLLLENFHRMPLPVRMAIVAAIFKAPPSRHVEIIKEELKWMVAQERRLAEVH